MYLFQRALVKGHGKIYFTLADYNLDVLRLVTIPNMLLTWAMVSHFTTTEQRTDWIRDSDIEITSQLLDAFLSSLQERNITVDGISGAWGDEFIDLMNQSPALSSLPPPSTARRLILASETIYSPDTLSSFTDVLTVTLRGVKGAKALVASKRVYFGVGGSVADFTRRMEHLGASVRAIKEAGREGVARVVLEVSFA